MRPTELLTLAEAIARAAGAVLATKFVQPRTVAFKGERHTDLVTDADAASEEVVLSWLAREVPSHGVLSEESGSVSSGAWQWFVDPLDGTTNYAHGVPHYAVTLAVAGPDGRLQAGVVFDPSRNELFRAARGHGAWCNERRLSCSTAAGLDRALMCTGFPYDVTQNPELPLGLFNRIVRRAQGIRRMGSAALDLSYVAAGRYDGFFEFGLKPWDTAAGALLIEEAGGVMKGIDGSPYRPDCLDVLACGAALDGELTQTCRDFVAALDWKPRTFR